MINTPVPRCENNVDHTSCQYNVIEGMFPVDEVESFVLIYADDQVVFSTSPTSVQSM